MTNSATTAFSIDSFVAKCRDALSHPDPASVVSDLLRAALRDRASIEYEVQRWRDAGGGEQGAMFRSDDLTILQASVPPGFTSPRHDHTMWAVIGVYDGQEDNTFYRHGASGLEETTRVSIRAGDVQVLPKEAIHRIANPLATTLLAIHVYGGDLLGVERSTWDDATGERQRFDLAAIRRPSSD